MTDLYELFKERAEAVSAEVRRFATEAEALAWLASFLRQEEVADAPGSYAVCAAGRLPLGETVPGLRFEVTREAAAEAKIGISRMDWGIAATGTLAQDATAVEQRLVSTLPAIHVALLSTDRILPDLAAVLAVANPARCGYFSFITGPSRTADIERVLTIGVHGPARLVILCVDQRSGTHE